VQQPPQATTDAASADDGAEYDELPAENEGRGWLRLGGFVVGMAAIGASMAVLWHYFSLQRLPSWSAAIAWTTPKASEPANDGHLVRLMRELEALKQSFGALDSAQQQMRGAIATLQADQQELRRRTAPATAAYWYSNPAALSLQVPVAPRRTAAAVAPARRPSGEGAVRRNSTPLKLVDQP
jgi:hypothetical protein